MEWNLVRRHDKPGHEVRRTWISDCRDFCIQERERPSFAVSGLCYYVALIGNGGRPWQVLSRHKELDAAERRCEQEAAKYRKLRARERAERPLLYLPKHA